MSDKPQGLNNTELNRIAAIIEELTGRIQWIDVEGSEEGILNYWREYGIKELSTFVKELQANRDTVSANREQLAYYANLQRDSVTRPAKKIINLINDWQEKHPNKSNGMAAIFNQHLKTPLQYVPDEKKELRETLKDIQGTLSKIKKAITTTMKPLFETYPLNIYGQVVSEKKPLLEHRTNITPNFFDLLTEKDKQTKQRKDEGQLTKRQRILIYFYEGGNMVERRHKDYNDYIKYCTPGKRLSYPNDSSSKLKHLIADIEKITPMLSGKARQYSDNELVTLKSRLTVEN